MTADSSDGDTQSGDVVLHWAQRGARVWATALVVAVAAIVAAHVYIFDEVNLGLAILGLCASAAAIPWLYRSVIRTEALRITQDRIIDSTPPLGVQRVFTWEQIHDVHLRRGQIVLDAEGAPPPSLFERWTRLHDGGPGAYFIPVNSLETSEDDVFELLDARIRDRIIAPVTHERLPAPDNDI